MLEAETWLFGEIVQILYWSGNIVLGFFMHFLSYYMYFLDFLFLFFSYASPKTVGNLEDSNYFGVLARRVEIIN